MAASKRPSFLKRQKEQKRTARAAEKREARRLRKLRKAAGDEDLGDPELDENLSDDVEPADEADGTDDV